MSTPATKRKILRAALGLALSAALLPACSDRSARAPTTTMTGAELLGRTARGFTDVRALHFTLVAHSVVPGVRFAAVTSGEGVVVRPNRLVFSGIMQSTPTLAAPVVIVMCDTNRYLELGDGNFIKMEALPDMQRLLFAPDTGLITGGLPGLEQPSVPEAATVADVPTWRVTGTVSERFLRSLPGRKAPAAAPLRAELWIGRDDLRLRQVTLTGPMFDSDSLGTVRTLTFSRFNEALPLAVPRGRLPCDSVTTAAPRTASAAAPTP